MVERQAKKGSHYHPREWWHSLDLSLSLSREKTPASWKTRVWRAVVFVLRSACLSVMQGTHSFEQVAGTAGHRTVCARGSRIGYPRAGCGQRRDGTYIVWTITDYMAGWRLTSWLRVSLSLLGTANRPRLHLHAAQWEGGQMFLVLVLVTWNWLNAVGEQASE